VQPDTTADTDQVEVAVTTNTTVGSVQTNTTEDITIDLFDSSGEDASETVPIELIDADTSDGSDNSSEDSNATVSLEGPSDATAGEPTQFDVVVSNPEAVSLGSYEFNLSMANEIGEITSIDLNGAPALTTVDISDDKSTARVEAALAETVAETNITVAELTITPTAGGTEQITLTDPYVSDTGGQTIQTENTEVSQDLPIAAFETSYSVSSTETEFGETVTVTATVSNTGDARDTTTTTLALNDEQVGTEETTLSPGASSTVSFALEPSQVGENMVRVNNLEPTAITVVQPGPGDITGNGQPAKDPDQDGVYEDVNGDGMVNTGDVSALFSNLGDTNSTGAAFDFNGDNQVNTGDLVALFQDLG
jgi:hypothetical protein